MCSGTACSHLCGGSVSRRRQCGWRWPLIRVDECMRLEMATHPRGCVHACMCFAKTIATWTWWSKATCLAHSKATGLAGSRAVALLAASCACVLHSSRCVCACGHACSCCPSSGNPIRPRRSSSLRGRRYSRSEATASAAARAASVAFSGLSLLRSVKGLSVLHLVAQQAFEGGGIHPCG